MILLSEDGKTLVKIDKWEDITERSGYRAKVDPKEVTLKQIIGRYHIEPKQPCGIASCGTAHNMGYLVACANGIETNIGNKCGKRIFGVDFQTLEKTFNRDTNAQRYRENISKTKNQLKPIEEKSKYLWKGTEQGAWCVDRIGWFSTKGFEQNTLDRLDDRARRNDPYIKKSFELTATEREAAKGSGNFSTFREENVATIYGLSAIKNYKKLKSLLTVTLGEEIEIFKSLNEDELTFDQLKRWNNWSNVLEKKLLDAENIIDECHRFLVPDNIQLIRSYKHII